MARTQNACCADGFDDEVETVEWDRTKESGFDDVCEGNLEQRLAPVHSDVLVRQPL